jgi:hypothetical protein
MPLDNSHKLLQLPPLITVHITPLYNISNLLPGERQARLIRHCGQFSGADDSSGRVFVVDCGKVFVGVWGWHPGAQDPEEGGL